MWIQDYSVVVALLLHQRTWIFLPLMPYLALYCSVKSSPERVKCRIPVLCVIWVITVSSAACWLITVRYLGRDAASGHCIVPSRLQALKPHSAPGSSSSVQGRALPLLLVSLSPFDRNHFQTLCCEWTVCRTRTTLYFINTSGWIWWFCCIHSCVRRLQRVCVCVMCREEHADMLFHFNEHIVGTETLRDEKNRGFVFHL